MGSLSSTTDIEGKGTVGEMSADRPDRPADPIRFRSSDDTDLVGDLSVPPEPWAAAVVCHPHPQYGGNRFHPVVAAIHRALPAAGIASLRFDVRSRFDGGPGELRDTAAALAHVRRAVPDTPVANIGYSFGALMALGAADDECFAVVAVAPPLASAEGVAPPRHPTLVITPEFDQFTDIAAVRRATADWADTTIETVSGADHFLVGSDAHVATRTCDFLVRQRTRGRVTERAT